MLDEQRVHASRGGLLPQEGPAGAHQAEGSLHPEEVDEGPIIPDTVIVDLNTGRLVRLRTGPGDDEDDDWGDDDWGDDDDDEDDDDEDERAPRSCVARAQAAVREVMTMPPGWQPPKGWQEPAALLPPHAGAPLLFAGTPPRAGMPAAFPGVGQLQPSADAPAGASDAGGATASHGPLVVDPVTGELGWWTTWHGTRVFVTQKTGQVYRGRTELEEAEQRRSIDAGVAKRQAAAERSFARTPPHQILGPGESVKPIGELPPADPTDIGLSVRVPGSSVYKDAAGKESPKGGFLARAPGLEEGRTAPLSRREQEAAKGNLKDRTKTRVQAFEGETKYGRVMRDFSVSHPVQRADVDKVLDYFDRASAEQLRLGTEWYPMARSIAERWSALTQDGPTPLSVSQVAGIMAAASPQTPWDSPRFINNLKQAHDCIFYNKCHHYQDSPKHPEKGRGVHPETGEVRWKNPTTGGGKMRAIRDGTPVDQVLAQQKEWGFYLDIMGLKAGDAVAFDRHMMGVVEFTGDLTEAKYNQYTRTVQAAARERNVPAEVMQAVAWLKYQQDHAPKIAARHRAEAAAKRRLQQVAPGKAAAVTKGQPRQRKASPAGVQKTGAPAPPHRGPPFRDPPLANPQKWADQLIAEGYYAPHEREALVAAIRHKNQTGLFAPPSGHVMLKHVEEAERRAREAYGPLPGNRGALPPEPQAPGGANALGLRRDRHAGTSPAEAEGEGEKQGWLTINREVEGEDGEPREEQTHIYVAHDGTILQGPEHLKGRHLSDLRGEGSIAGQQRKESPEPYHSAGRQGGAAPAHESGKIMRGPAGREMDTWRSHEKSKMLFQTEDHLNSLVRRGYVQPGEARAMLERAYADRADRAARAKGLGS